MWNKTKLVSLLSKISLVILLVLPALAPAQNHDLKNINNGSFKPGEKFRLRVHYGFIDAGYLSLEVTNEVKNFGTRPCWHIVGIGTSAGAFDFFFKIRDRYESYIDASAIVPWFHARNVREGGFKFSETDNFNHYTNSVVNNFGTYKVPDQVQDLLTCFYYTRCAYTGNMNEGDIIPVKAFFDNEVTSFNVKYIGREVLKTDVGTVNCLKFRPQLQKGRIFKDKEDMTIYVSDDKNYIPIRLEAKLVVGAVKADLIEYSGLANPFTALQK